MNYTWKKHKGGVLLVSPSGQSILLQDEDALDFLSEVEDDTNCLDNNDIIEPYFC